MKIRGAIGLTGGIACGKSTVAATLAGMGVPVLDADIVARQLLTPGHWAYEKVKQQFGNEILNEEGFIDRRRLGDVVFRDPRKRQEINAIMHPAVYQQIDDGMRHLLDSHPFAVAMIPLLYETGDAGVYEKVIVVASDTPRMMERMMARGWTRDEALRRMEAQMPVAEKVKRADAVIWNNDDLATLRRATISTWNKTVLGKE